MFFIFFRCLICHQAVCSWVNISVVSHLHLIRLLLRLPPSPSLSVSMPAGSERALQSLSTSFRSCFVSGHRFLPASAAGAPRWPCSGRRWNETVMCCSDTCFGSDHITPAEFICSVFSGLFYFVLRQQEWTGNF